MSPAHRFPFEITPQPSETTCGPAALQSVYRHWGLELPVDEVIDSVTRLDGGGTWAVHLGRDALSRGFRARIYTCDLQLFDPSWFAAGGPPLADRLRLQVERRDQPAALAAQGRAYLDFLERGGEVRMEEMGTELVTRYLRRGIPVIAGLCCTWLYRSARERWDGERAIPDDLEGTPTGHFVVVHGVDPDHRALAVADPFLHPPYPGEHHYEVPIRRFFNALMLGVVTNDAKLLVLRPPAHD